MPTSYLEGDTHFHIILSILNEKRKEVKVKQNIELEWVM